MRNLFVSILFLAVFLLQITSHNAFSSPSALTELQVEVKKDHSPDFFKPSAEFNHLIRKNDSESDVIVIENIWMTKSDANPGIQEEQHYNHYWQATLFQLLYPFHVFT